MKRYKKFMYALLLALAPGALSAQQITPSPTTDADDTKWGISPQVALMNRFGYYPVNLQNGLVDVSVPLYTITTPSGLELPLELKFHASGLRADEREGMFGIRWALAGGGHVSRIIKGYADDFYPFDNQVSSSSYQPDFYTLFGTSGNKARRGGTEPGNNSAFTSSWYMPPSAYYYFNEGSYKDTEYDIFPTVCRPGKAEGLS